MNEPESLRPLFSARAEEPELSEDLDDFLLALAVRVDDLQDAHSRGENDEMTKMVRSLAEDADRLGHGDLSRAALCVARALECGKAEEIHTELVELTVLARRARLAHRGAFE